MKLISKVTEMYCIADDFCKEYRATAISVLKDFSWGIVVLSHEADKLRD